MSNLLAQIWAGARPLADYATGMTKYQDQMIQRLETVRLTDEQRQSFAGIDNVRGILVTTEDWCGDAVLNVPIMARIAEAMGHAELRVTVRSANEAWKEYLFGRELVHVPVIMFLDSALNELGVWMERPQAATKLFMEWKTVHPEYVQIRDSTELTAEERSLQLRPWTQRLLADMHTWYDGSQNVQQATVDEIHGVLARIHS
jgi:hypothetical protein